ncbi:ABC transporter ATP-binding protein [Kineosporia babensis]|uniref:ABC transporter ATP-binding protein n=1 Tax=Kineosporia babensis TaxID=499548 RepID=A0A9X1STG7_9ACTN|nr:ABC transporter ATP-binding protein [Kineosporia babensis]MCD5311859.1 ABC transporter ATP-binding protein [Kineosporia babensis]
MTRPLTEPAPTSVHHSAVAVTLDGISHTYKSRAGHVPALRGVTHTFVRGTFTAVMGPSGSGKSTLLQVAAGLDRPTQGEVRLGDVALGGLSQTQLTKLRRTSMAFVFQAYNLLDALTAFENVALPARLAGRRVDKAAVREALRQVGLEEKTKRRPPELSGGQQQRVAIARALHLQPEVLFADEPTGALDRSSGRRVLELLREASDVRGQTVVMVTHDPLAASYAHSTLFLEDGQIVGRLERADATQIAATMSELER